MSLEVFSISEPDSRRFGLRVVRCRLDVPIDDPVRARQTLQAMDADVLVLRVRSGDVSTPRALVRASDELIYADSIVYYSTALPPVRAFAHTHRLDAGICLRQAVVEDAPAVGELARASFSRYPSHYAANPRLASRGDIGAGYAEWAMGHVSASDRLLPAWVAVNSGRIVGFVTVKVREDNAEAEILLNAVASEFEGRGVYTALLHEILSRLQAAGIRVLCVSTQLSNIRVQRVWSRLGMSLVRAYDTYHVNLWPRANDAGLLP